MGLLFFNARKVKYMEADMMGNEKGHPVEKNKKVYNRTIRYKKGEFTVVPNLGLLSILPPQGQSIFMWICYFSDQDGVCFPSRKTLANAIGIKDARKADRYLSLLEKYGFIEVVKRKDDNGRNMTNVYRILTSGIEVL